MDVVTDILILDNNEEFVKKVKEKLKKHKNIRLVTSIEDGTYALETICQHKPDIVLMDLILPKLKERNISSQLAQRGMKEMPAFVVASEFLNDKILLKAAALGIDLFMFKPMDCDMLGQRIYSLSTFLPTITDIAASYL